MGLKKLILANRLLTNMAIYVNKLRLRREKQISFGKGAFIGFSVVCEGRNSFGVQSSITSSSIGYGSYISQNTKIAKATIGRYCSIGPNVNCIFGMHPSNTFVSTHPVFFSRNTPMGISYVDKQLFNEYPEPVDGDGKYTISIGNDVWIGANVSILDGVRIGDGAIVAANALVNKDVAPYNIVGGIPAKVIKKRFTDQEILFLLQLKWWNQSEDWIKENAIYFADIQAFKSKFSDE